MVKQRAAANENNESMLLMPKLNMDQYEQLAREFGAKLTVRETDMPGTNLTSQEISIDMNNNVLEKFVARAHEISAEALTTGKPKKVK